MYIIFWTSSFLFQPDWILTMELAILEHLKYPHRFIMDRCPLGYLFYKKMENSGYFRNYCSQWPENL